MMQASAAANASATSDLVYIPLSKLTAVDFAVKLVVNAALAIALSAAVRRARIIFS
jgi:hypothetical protein